MTCRSKRPTGLTIVWAMVAAACLTLAVIHALVWWPEREAWSNLLFSFAAAGTAGLGACEYWMMQATTIPAFGTALRWLHVPAVRGLPGRFPACGRSRWCSVSSSRPTSTSERSLICGRSHSSGRPW